MNEFAIAPIGGTTELRTEFSGQPVIVEERVGGGGQGEVYRASMAGKKYAVKWYSPLTIELDPGLGKRLRTARDRGVPGSISKDPVIQTISTRFLWPIDLVLAKDMPGLFGYIMPWMEGRFVDFTTVLQDRVRPCFRSLATAAIETAGAYNMLHAAGFCYKDINPGNVALDPDTGEVRICDNDNVDVNGEEGAVGGTWGFMAPEIVHELFVARRAHPNADTDRWSLAVLLFHFFVRSHPLEGDREGPLFDEYALHGPDACFIWDEKDESNRPTRHRNALRFWPILPRFLQRLFLKTFTDGIRQPSERVSTTDWRKAMVRLRDAISPCPACGTENFHDVDANVQTSCWSCSRPLSRPLLLDVRKSRSGVVMAPDATLFPHHLDPRRSFDFSKSLAKVERRPDLRPDALVLRNLADQPWQVTDGGVQDIVGPREVLVLYSGQRIDFGQVEGVVS
jgi:DNA-binding helix-hairpin-helix protein with protein kinase domain